eukprot:1160445-Pelagomonas_calceolata.AAC.13
MHFRLLPCRLGQELSNEMQKNDGVCSKFMGQGKLHAGEGLCTPCWARENYVSRELQGRMSKDTGNEVVNPTMPLNTVGSVLTACAPDLSVLSYFLCLGRVSALRLLGMGITQHDSYTIDKHAQASVSFTFLQQQSSFQVQEEMWRRSCKPRCAAKYLRHVAIVTDQTANNDAFWANCNSCFMPSSPRLFGAPREDLAVDLNDHEQHRSKLKICAYNGCSLVLKGASHVLYQDKRRALHELTGCQTATEEY